MSRRRTGLTTVEPRYVEKSDLSIVREKKSTLVERELERIYVDNETLTPTLIVESATKPTSPLHRYFEWDDKKASEKYRLAQATQMILATKFVCVLEEQNDIVPRVLHAEQHTARLVRKFLPAHGSGEGFIPRTDVLADAEMRAALIDRKKSALRSWCRGVIDIRELDALRLAIEKMLAI